jgi:hypothetical protein
MRKMKIIYWITTSLVFLMEGVLPALTSQTELAKEGIRHLQYPEYFGNALHIGMYNFHRVAKVFRKERTLLTDNFLSVYNPPLCKITDDGL